MDLDPLPAQDLLTGEIMPGHAIVLARPLQDDQRRAIETEDALFRGRAQCSISDPRKWRRGRERRKTQIVWAEPGSGIDRRCG